MLSGYVGKIGWVDLNRRTTRVEALDESTAGNYLGGKALGAYLLYSHLKPNIDPYDPANMLIFQHRQQWQMLRQGRGRRRNGL